MSEVKIGAPSIYTQDLADDICALIVMGKSIRTICAEEGMPSIQTLFRWIRENKEGFREQYARAKEEQADALAEEMLDIADDGKNDWMEKFSSDGESLGWFLNGEHVQRSKVRLDTRKWLASKLKPKKYGDRLLQENQALDKNGQPTDPNITTVTHKILAKFSTNELEEILEQSQDNNG